MTADGIGRGSFARARKIRVGLALGMGRLLALAWPAAPSSAHPTASSSTFAVAPFQLSASAPLAPAGGAAVRCLAQVAYQTWTTVEFAEFESVVGREMDVNHRFHAWGGTYWPSSSDRWDVLNGRIPLASLGGPISPAWTPSTGARRMNSSPGSQTGSGSSALHSSSVRGGG